MQHCVWFCGCHCHAVRGVVSTVMAPCGCCGCQRRAVWVLWLLVSCRVGVAAAGVMLCGCCGCCRRAVCGLAGAIVALRMVPRVLSSRHTWCCGRCRHMPRGVMVTVITPRVVSWSRPSCRVVLWSWRVLSHRVVSWSWLLRHV